MLVFNLNMAKVEIMSLGHETKAQPSNHFKYSVSGIFRGHIPNMIISDRDTHPHMLFLNSLI